jgi:hypothetical protein
MVNDGTSLSQTEDSDSRHSSGPICVWTGTQYSHNGNIVVSARCDVVNIHCFVEEYPGYIFGVDSGMRIQGHALVYGCDYEECRLLGYKNPVRTSQETHYVSAPEHSRLMLCKI